MGLLNFPNAPTNPGSLHGATRQHRALIENQKSETFRSGAQSQNTSQAARAFSGAQVSNTQSQVLVLTHNAEAFNNKIVTIGAVLSSFSNAGNFDNNVLQRYIAGAVGNDLLAQSAVNVAQDQGVDQSASSQLNDFSGTDSDADNALTQNAFVSEVFDVDLTVTVVATTQGALPGNAFQIARHRTIEAELNDQSAQGIFTAGQRQGHEGTPMNQIAVADGADSNNTLTQLATIDQSFSAQTVNFGGTFNLTRDEPNTVALSPRGTDLLASMNRNSAINTGAASQEQFLMQSGGGGLNEDGNITENSGNARNDSQSSALNTEDSVITNSVSVII